METKEVTNDELQKILNLSVRVGKRIVINSIHNPDDPTSNSYIFNYTIKDNIKQ